jgi:pimeloyl-ACP methyl ester carboxylesterase
MVMMPPLTRVSPALAICLAGLVHSQVLQTPAGPAPVPFRVHVSDEVLEDLKRRLAMTRWPDQLPGSGWDRGPDTTYLMSLCDYWRTGFDWRAQEARLNAWPQFTVALDGLEVHFIHARSRHDHATPLVLVHGWPGSFVEFLDVIGPLTDPQAHGGKAEDAFHVVVPSLPGFGFSSKPREPGWNSQRMAEIVAKLMARLGYERYGAQGGDWGGGIVRWLAANDERCLGAHSNFPPMARSDKDTTAEARRAEQRMAELADHKAYGAIQGTRPLALGYGLNDSPAGLAAWILDKFWAWSDHDGNLESRFSKDALLTNITVYWATQTMPSSVRIYYESSHTAPRPTTMTPFQSRQSPPAPMGFALFPKEINVPSRAGVERIVPQVIHWTQMPHGGHFAAMEQPALLIQDIREFFEKVRRLPPRAP